MTGFEAYQKYIALKNHFTRESYDYFKYGGKTSVKQSTFEARKDKYMFHKLAKKKDVEGLIISNMIVNEKVWVKDLLEIESESVYTEWLKRQQSLGYIFNNDLEYLNTNFNENLLVSSNEYPYLLKLYMRNQISIETLVIIEDIVRPFNYWNKQIHDPIVWPSIYTKCKKYRPFLQFDKHKFKEQLKKRFE